MSISFRIHCRNGRLLLEEQGLTLAAKTYLETYLEKLNHYRPIGFFQNSPVFSLYQPPIASLSGMRSLQMRINRRFTGERIPATATIAVNKACQCECEHCSAVQYNHSVEKELSFLQLQQAVSEATALGVTNLIFLGGEPLLRKDLNNLIGSVSPSQACTIMFTNGEFLTFQRCLELKAAGLMGVFVSLDCAQPKRHDQFRKREGLFDKAIAGITNLKKAGLLVGISTHLSPTRMKENGFAEMMELGKDLSVNEVTFFDAIPSGRWLMDDSCVLTQKDRLEIKRLVSHYRELPGYPGISAQSTMTSECGSAFCFAANTQFYLSATGDMCPCDFTPLSFGKFPESSIAELWKKMTQSVPYDKRAKSCRMQDRKFREAYLLPTV